MTDFAYVNNQKNSIGIELSNIANLYDTERDRNAVVVNALQTEIERKNI